MTLKHYHYHMGDCVIRITAKKFPGPYTAPKSGTWIIREYNNGEWVMPCMPEITWGVLKSGLYLGCVYKQDDE